MICAIALCLQKIGKVLSGGHRLRSWCPLQSCMLGSYSSRELCADMSLCSAAAPQRLYSPQRLLRASSGCSMCKYLAGRAGGALSVKQASLPPLLCPACWRLVAICIAEALQAMREL